MPALTAMPPSSTELRGPARRIHLSLGVDGATSSTTLTGTEGTERVTTMYVAYRPTPHGLCRWTDPVDGRSYVIGSGALDGAAHFVAGTNNPADRMRTELSVEPCTPGDVVRATTGDLANHHLGLVSGPWRIHAAPGMELLSRQDINRPLEVSRLLEDTRRALHYLLEWFDAAEAPLWGETYTQVLVPDTPWLALEHPGCVLVSERLLDAPPGRRVAVIAHEAAHQWLGNLVTPRRWRDVGVFEGLAEFLGQLACEELLGTSASSVLARRRAKGVLVRPPTTEDLRAMPSTAGLAEVAGPVQHAELFRQVAAELGAGEFQTRMREVVRCHAGSSCSAKDIWDGLGVAPRYPRELHLPRIEASVPSPWRDALRDLQERDPASAAMEARRAFRRHSPGLERVRQALASMTDSTTPYPVSAGLSAELSRSETEPVENH